MSKSKVVFFVISLIMLASCSTVQHWSDQEANVDFSGYHTYVIDEQCSDYNPGINPIHQQRIKNAIELELRNAGYTRSDNPDISIKYFVKSETKFFYENCLPEYDNFVGGNVCVDKVYGYDVGTLVIDLIDVRKNMAIWHGGAEGGSWEKMDQPERKINNMVKVIMSDYLQLVGDVEISPSESKEHKCTTECMEECKKKAVSMTDVNSQSDSNH